jgi:hypothetical protein
MCDTKYCTFQFECNERTKRYLRDVKIAEPYCTVKRYLRIFENLSGERNYLEQNWSGGTDRIELAFRKKITEGKQTT